jgi:hypothetical protein
MKQYNITTWPQFVVYNALLAHLVGIRALKFTTRITQNGNKYEQDVIPKG